MKPKTVEEGRGTVHSTQHDTLNVAIRMFLDVRKAFEVKGIRIRVHGNGKEKLLVNLTITQVRTIVWKQ